MTILPVFHAKTAGLTSKAGYNLWASPNTISDQPKATKMTQLTDQTPTVTGNYFNKHLSKNIIVRMLVDGYRRGLQSLVEELPVRIVFEVGSGEGFILEYLFERCPETRLIGSDIDLDLIRESRNRLPQFEWLITVGERTPFSTNAFDLTICCEVLEHVQNPEVVLAELRRITRQYLIISVPHEPYWRILNMLRGKYWRQYGNTPGHVNHWNTPGIKKTISRSFSVQKILHVFPWIFILAKK